MEAIFRLVDTFPDCCVRNVPTKAVIDLLNSGSDVVPIKKLSHLRYLEEDVRSFVKYQCVLFRDGMYSDCINGHTPCRSWFDNYPGDLPDLNYDDVAFAHENTSGGIVDTSLLCDLL